MDINKKYNLQLDKLCSALGLGRVIATPKTISGGLLHRMYCIETSKGKYAIKALNPQIMLRPTAMKNYINSEKVASFVSGKVPALPAKEFNDNHIQELDGQYYLVFDWIEGKSLKGNDINLVHCEKMGTLLADIHKTDFSELGITNEDSTDLSLIDWDYYLEKGIASNSEWVGLLQRNIEQLCHWNTEANNAARLLSSNMVISHRDLDPKNVMWKEDNPIIIDWEAVGYVNPMVELVETALYWAEDGVGEINKDRFMAFLNGYKARYGAIEAPWDKVLMSGFVGKFGWLEYNMKRSLGIECSDEKEQQLGTNEVLGTIEGILRYGGVICRLEEWLGSV